MEITFPPLSELIMFSIFIASRVINLSPDFTVSPTLTCISRIVPGMGDFTMPAPFGTDGELVFCSSGVISV